MTMVLNPSSTLIDGVLYREHHSKFQKLEEFASFNAVFFYVLTISRHNLGLVGATLSRLWAGVAGLGRRC